MYVPLQVSELIFFDKAIAVAKILSSLETCSSLTKANKEAFIMEPFVVAHLHIFSKNEIKLNVFIGNFLHSRVTTKSYLT